MYQRARIRWRGALLLRRRAVWQGLRCAPLISQTGELGTSFTHEHNTATTNADGAWGFQRVTEL